MRVLLKNGGNVSVGLALVGIFLPVLPTTPFVMLAFFLFDRSDSRYRDWLVNHPRLGPIVKEYSSNEGIKLKAKIKALALLWISISISIVFFIKNIYTQSVVLFVAVCVTFYILSRKTRS